jgi:hypothetical protein
MSYIFYPKLQGQMEQQPFIARVPTSATKTTTEANQQLFIARVPTSATKTTTQAGV